LLKSEIFNENLHLDNPNWHLQQTYGVTARENKLGPELGLHLWLYVKQQI